MADAGLASRALPPRPRAALAVLVAALRVGPTNDTHPLVKAYHQLLVWDITKAPFVTRFTERVLNPCDRQERRGHLRTKPGRDVPRRTHVWLPDVDDLVSGREPRAHRRPHRIAPARPTGWSSGSPAATPTRGTTARRSWPSRWAVDGPTPSVASTGCGPPSATDGAWHQYYLADRVEQDKLDANCVAYVAAAVWHHWLLLDDRGFLETMWPTVEAAIEFVLELQTPSGRDPLGPPRRRHPVVVRAAHRLVVDLPQPPLRHRDRRGRSATSAPTGSSPPLASPA